MTNYSRSIDKYIMYNIYRIISYQCNVHCLHEGKGERCKGMHIAIPSKKKKREQKCIKKYIQGEGKVERKERERERERDAWLKGSRGATSLRERRI